VRASTVADDRNVVMAAAAASESTLDAGDDGMADGTWMSVESSSLVGPAANCRRIHCCGCCSCYPTLQATMPCLPCRTDFGEVGHWAYSYHQLKENYKRIGLKPR